MDPYKVLGVSYNASDDEIKKAYRQLSRKYHPDANVGNPNQEQYEEKFKEVQQAYNLIMDQRQGKAQAQQGYGDDFWGFGSYTNAYGGQSQQTESQDEKYLRSALNYIQNGYYREGLNVLEQVQERRGPWFYYSAFANYKVGNNAIAIEHAKAACAFEPNNYHYANLLRQMQGGETRYQQRSAQYGGNPSMYGSNYCGQMCGACLVANLCCGGGYMGLPIILCC
ncbi:MAG: DnaJ domain-containing protein [Firmicutes bacterium]|nr:DnaJ domain-containing protein [Bacillota bacterium]MBR3707164.1 DnaJ domain-containing protein [Bacillota bacterium]MBR6585094.1 DnaJ domain-containing protein [Bacillota bacterium]